MAWKKCYRGRTLLYSIKQFWVISCVIYCHFFQWRGNMLWLLNKAIHFKELWAIAILQNIKEPYQKKCSFHLSWSPFLSDYQWHAEWEEEEERDAEQNMEELSSIADQKALPKGGVKLALFCRLSENRQYLGCGLSHTNSVSFDTFHRHRPECKQTYVVHAVVKISCSEPNTTYCET